MIEIVFYTIFILIAVITIYSFGFIRGTRSQRKITNRYKNAYLESIKRMEKEGISIEGIEDKPAASSKNR